jgi:putative FmdB family regulatory protein
MPLYEYECDVCGHRFEKIQKFSDPLEDKCPTCAGHVHKLQSSPAIQFKGSGFYITDYGKDGKGPRKPESESAPATETKSSEAKPDKAETKASSKPEASPGKSSSRPPKGKAASE